MHNRHRETAQRLDRAMAEYIRPAIYPHRRPLTVTAWPVLGEPVPVEAALVAPYQPFAVGQRWGPPWSTLWLRLTGDVPIGWAGRRVELMVDLGFADSWPGFQAEGLAYDREGVPLKGIAPRNRHIPVAAPAVGGEPIDVFVEAAANPTVMGDFRTWAPSPLGDPGTAGSQPLYRLEAADVAVRDDAVWHLSHDLDVLRQLADQLGGGSQRGAELWHAIGHALDTIDLHDVPGTAERARLLLAPVLARPAAQSAHRVSAVGHAHIDTAWLWPLRETVRKAARTFANVVALAQEYPQLVFAASQAQQYQWIREQQPHLWQRVLKAVADGTFVPTGGMWVESDTNLPGGEALARQLVYGKRFFLDAFGIETRDVWLPDSFGYTPALPQLARLAGNEWFLTQKLSWNSANRIPHSTFWWEGIDGSRIFTHMPPVDTYNAELTGAELARAERQFSDSGPASRSLVPFGYGDGGGGPTREMLERATRLYDLDGSPVVRLESPSTFFAAAQAEYADAPTWVGELYLELHRGTYTTQAKNKAGNRHCEHLLREAELWATTASVHSGAPYPYAALERIWQRVLTLQFHDILPGSAIAWVNREAREAYQQIVAELERLIEESAQALPGTGRTWLNAGPFSRAEVVVVDDADGTGQRLADGRVAVWAEAPALGAGRASTPPPTAVTVRTDGPLTIMDNGVLRVTIDGDGLLGSVVDLAIGREVVPTGLRANLLQLHPDHPAKWDAWDIDRHYRNSHTDLVAVDSIVVVDRGPLIARVTVARRHGATAISQTYELAAGSARLDIDTEIDWRESEKLLKAAFPLDVHTERSTAEIQFGHLHRPIHANTSWDDARFEIWAHRWLHVGEPDYGIAVCNDATYGHDVTRAHADDGGTVTTVRLTLLRAPHTPDPGADRDVHRFTYALAPGAGIPAAIREGYRLNLPLRASDRGGELPTIVAVDHPGVVIEAVKLADDRSGDIVVRLYEAHGNRATASVTTSFGVATASVTDLLERPQTPADLTPAGVVVTLRPFQILTLRLARA